MSRVNQKRESVGEVYAYTPGLKVKKQTTLSKTRLLPIPGEVLTEKGRTLDYDTIVARTTVPGKPTIINVAKIIDIKPEHLSTFMVKGVGDYVEEGEIIAKYSFLWGLINRFATAPIQGTIESLSNFTGQVVIREPPIPVEIKAYIPGTVIETIPRRGVVIETQAAFIQGIFGIGGENHGQLAMVANSPEDILTAEKIGPEHKGKILVGGSLVTLPAFRKAEELGVYGIIVGGINGDDLKEILGLELGVAITGHEEMDITLIVLEGFGQMRMSIMSFNLFKEYEGYEVALNGATQIRAGVVRPEVIIPHDKHASGDDEEKLPGGMLPGTQVRIIREPYFGKIGTVVSLPVDLKKIETESLVRVLEVKLEEGNVIVPRANVEIIEE